MALRAYHCLRRLRSMTAHGSSCDGRMQGIHPHGNMLDPDSTGWLCALEGTEAEKESAHIRLHAMLLRIARHEVRRRSGYLQIGGAGA